MAQSHTSFKPHPLNTPELRADLVRRARRGESARSMAKEVGVSHVALGQWLRQGREEHAASIAAAAAGRAQTPAETVPQVHVPILVAEPGTGRVRGRVGAARPLRRGLHGGSSAAEVAARNRADERETRLDNRAAGLTDDGVLAFETPLGRYGCEVDQPGELSRAIRTIREDAERTGSEPEAIEDAVRIFTLRANAALRTIGLPEYRRT